MILSERLIQNLNQTNLKPIIVWQIDGIDTLYTTTTIKRKLNYGESGLEYGMPGLVYGGLIDVENQEPILSLDGTTTQIKQVLDPDKGRGSGVSQMSISLIDKNQKATKLATGSVDGEILYRRCKVWVGFNDDSEFNKDFILIFRGTITGYKGGQGKVVFDLASPDDKKRQVLLPKADTELDGAINNSVTTITLASVQNLFVVPNHPAYSPKDTSIKTYVRIDDELIEYTGISGLQLTGCVRGQLDTIAVSHTDETQVESFFLLEGNAMDLALKIMLSDSSQTPYITDLNANSVNIVDSDVIPNAIYFSGIDLTRDYNVRVGDYVKTQSFTNSGNNFSTYRAIVDVSVTVGGSYLVVDGAALIDEATATGNVTFLSYWNSLGFGLGMNTDEVDIERHDFYRRSFLSNFNYRFFVRDEIEEGKEFIEKELYIPASCYSLPTDRDGLSRVSVGIHKAPLPNQGIITLDQSNIKKPEGLELQRNANKYFYNAIVIRYEDTPLEDKFFRRVFVVPGTVTVESGNRAKVIESKGLKDLYNAKLISTQSGERLLDRYSNAAEYFQKINVKMKEAVQINVGDIVVLDGDGLNLMSSESQDRNRPARLMEVLNKDIDIKSGSASLDLIDTAFNIDSKYGLFSPSSRVATVLSQKKFVIEPLLSGGKYGAAEYRKWVNLKKPAVKIRKLDWSQVFETVLEKVSFNTIELRDNVSFTLTGGEVMELASYSNANTTDQVKLIFAYWSDGTNDFPDGKPPYQFV